MTDSTIYVRNLDGRLYPVRLEGRALVGPWGDTALAVPVVVIGCDKTALQLRKLGYVSVEVWSRKRHLQEMGVRG